MLEETVRKRLKPESWPKQIHPGLHRTWKDDKRMAVAGFIGENCRNRPALNPVYLNPEKRKKAFLRGAP